MYASRFIDCNDDDVIVQVYSILSMNKLGFVAIGHELILFFKTETMLLVSWLEVELILISFRLTPTYVSKNVQI